MGANVSLDEKLSDDEFAQMITLLRRYTATEMDQWELWKFDIPSSTIYVSVSMGPVHGGEADMYTDLGHLLK